MSSTCCICPNKINNQRKAVKCIEKSCLRMCHLECLEPNEKMENWRCKECEEPSLADLMREIKYVGSMYKDLVKSLDSCHEKIEENNKLIKKQETKIIQCVSQIEEATMKCITLEKENKELKINLNNQEQYTRLNSVEIYGIPEVREENVLSTIAQIGNTLRFTLNSNTIDCCYRINRQQKTTEPRGIFLKFVSRLLKEEFMKAKKTKRTLCLEDFDLGLARSVQDLKKPVYINESLTGANRALFAKCREFKKKHNIKFLWVKDGKILMRKVENAKVFVIMSESNFNDVH